jgi:uncharacterized protein
MEQQAVLPREPVPDRARGREEPAAWIEALRRQLAKRESPAGMPVELIETHISWVLLAGEHAYKIKKPVQLGFLDFSTPAARQHFCEEELRLNRRLAPSLYLDVLGVRGTPSAPRLDGGGPAFDWAVRMRRFPAGALLSERVVVGLIEPDDIDRLAARIAAFHDTAPVAAGDGPWGTAELVAASLRDCVRRLGSAGLGAPALAGWIEGQIPRHSALWAQRLREGRVREVHGDLHLANTVRLADGEVTAFDCIEFDPALRWIDVLSDTAFLAMDLMAHGREDLAWRFLNAYLDATGDHAGLPVLRVYMVYRALVRALVGSLAGAAHTAPGTPTPAQYVALAQRLAAPTRSQLLVTHGVSGSGKSHLTAALLESVGAVRLRSDVERKRLFGRHALDATASPLRGGLYGPECSARTYDHLLHMAGVALAAGWSVIVDATFLHRPQRDRFHGLALSAGARFRVLDCRAGTPVLRERVRARSERHDDASEADETVLASQLVSDEPLAEDEAPTAIVVDTDQGVDTAALAARWRRS